MSDMPDERPSPEELDTLAELSRALGRDPLPAGLVDRLNALVTWADVDAELAALLDDNVLVGTRGPAVAGTSRRFELADGSITIELTMPTSVASQQVRG